ncbi:MAG: RluA family pseudouridine synthase [Acidimicrobiales bacterium]
MSEAVRVVAPAPLDGERVDRVVSFLTGMPRADAAAAIDAGAVSLRGSVVTSRSARVRDGDELEIVLPERPGPPGADPAVAVDVVHADADVVVVEKPAGLVVHPGAGNPGGTLVNGLLARVPDMAGRAWPDTARPGIVHRIDKGTSGLLMVARTPAAMVALAAQLEAHTVERCYLALVWGTIEPASGVVDAPLGRSIADPTKMTVRADGRRALTRYEVVDQWMDPQPTTLLRCTLETGRTHQIRVHLAAIGHPVVGDDRYLQGSVGRQGPVLDIGPDGPRRSRARRRGAIVAPGLAPGRPFLHAAVLGFVHPGSGNRMRFESDLPADLRGTLSRVGRGGAD